MCSHKYWIPVLVLLHFHSGSGEPHLLASTVTSTPHAILNSTGKLNDELHAQSVTNEQRASLSPLPTSTTNRKCGKSKRVSFASSSLPKQTGLMSTMPLTSSYSVVSTTSTTFPSISQSAHFGQDQTMDEQSANTTTTMMSLEFLKSGRGLPMPSTASVVPMSSTIETRSSDSLPPVVAETAGDSATDPTTTLLSTEWNSSINVPKQLDYGEDLENITLTSTNDTMDKLRGRPDDFDNWTQNATTDLLNSTAILLKERDDALRADHLMGEEVPLNLGLENFKNKIDKAVGEGAKEIQDNVNDLMANVEEAFAGITNLSTVSLDQLQEYPTKLWATAKDELLKTLNFEKATKILEKIKSAGDTSTWIKLMDVLKDKLDPGQVLSLIKSANPNKDPSMSGLVQSVSRRLGYPSTWNESLIAEMGTSILALPPAILMQINNPDAKKQLLTILGHPEAGVQSGGQPYGNDILVLQLVEEIYGPIESWKNINESLVQYLPILPPLILKMLTSEAVGNSLSTLGHVDFLDRAHAQPLIAKAIKHANFSSQGTEGARDFFKNMGKLTSYMMAQDVKDLPRHLMQDDEIRNAISRHAIDEQLGRWLIQQLKPREGEWTSADVSRLQPILKYANGQLLSNLVAENLLDRPTLFTILQKNNLDRSQLQAIIGLAESIFKHNGHWDVNSMPPALLQILTSDEIKDSRAVDVANNMFKFNKVANRLDGAQAMAVTSKLQEIGLQRITRIRVRPDPVFISLVSNSDLLSLGDSELQQLLQDMPVDSPQVMSYVENKWAKQNITLDHLRQDLLLARSLSCEMLEQFPSGEVMRILSIIRSASCPLSRRTTKCLSEKLKLYLRSLSDDQNDNEIKLLSTLKESEIGIVGGDILVHFSAEALQQQTPRSKCTQIFSLIGNLPLSTLNLLQPYEKKRQMARAVLNCIDKQEDRISLLDMSVIGNLMGYLHDNAIYQMDDEAFTLYLPHLIGEPMESNGCDALGYQSLSSSPAFIGPCLNVAFRNAIRRKLITVFGLPETWEEVEIRSIGCLLSTLYADQLRQIKDNALLSASDQLNRCWDGDTVPLASRDKNGIYRTFCKNELLSSIITIEDAGRQLKVRLKDAALRQLQQPERIRRSNMKMGRSKRRLTCEILTKASSTITEMTLDELESISNHELRDCLEEFGKYPLSKEKATLLWNKVKKAYDKTAETLDQTTYYLMGYILQGMNQTEINTLRLDNTSFIGIFGTHRNFTHDQLRGIAVQVKADYQSDAGRFTISDLLTFGYIICGFEKSDIEKISPSVFTEVSYRLSDALATCQPETKSILVDKAIQGFGEPANWTAAVITSTGAILGGLSAEQLSTIPGRSFEGLQPNYVNSISPEVIKVLRPEQLGNFSVEAVNYLSQDQLSQFSSKQMEAVNQLKSLYNIAELVFINQWIIYFFASANVFFCTYFYF